LGCSATEHVLVCNSKEVYDALLLSELGGGAKPSDPYHRQLPPSRRMT